MNKSACAVAFIGAGTAAEMHGRAVKLNRDAFFCGAYDLDLRNARRLCERFGGKIYGSEAELLADPAVQAVYILTPTEHHVAQAAAALAAGKHVLVEKPVALKPAEIDRLEKLAMKHGRVCMPGHNYIYVPALVRGKRLIEAGKLGEVASAWVLYNIFHSEEVARRYGGVLREVCVHHIYSLIYLLGRPVSVIAQTTCLHYRELKCEDQVMLTCRMPNGALANLWASFAASDPTSHPWSVAYKVLGTNGAFGYDWNDAQFEDRGGPAWGLPCYEDGFIGATEHFIGRCIAQGEPALSTLADARDTLHVIEAAERSLRSGRVETISY